MFTHVLDDDDILECGVDDEHETITIQYNTVHPLSVLLPRFSFLYTIP